MSEEMGAKLNPISARANIESANRTFAASEGRYQHTDLGIRPANEETGNIISQTFGALKNSIEALWGGQTVGMDENVSFAVNSSLVDPEKSFSDGNRVFYEMSNVGHIACPEDDMIPYFTMHTIG